MQKFELVAGSQIEVFGKTLFRIKALISFGQVSAGDEGGFVEKEGNLSQEGDAWVSGNAQVYDDARVCGDAWVSGNAQVYDDAWVSGNAQVYDDARVCGDAWVYDDARVYDDAWVSGNAQVSGNAWVCGDARVYDDARVCGDAWVSGNAQVSGNAWVCGDASIFWATKVGSENGAITAYTARGGLMVNRGCFHGAIDEFASAVEKRHGDTQVGEEYRLLIQFIRMRLSGAQSEIDAQVD